MISCPPSTRRVPRSVLSLNLIAAGCRNIPKWKNLDWRDERDSNPQPPDPRSRGWLPACDLMGGPSLSRDHRNVTLIDAEFCLHALKRTKKAKSILLAGLRSSRREPAF